MSWKWTIKNIKCCRTWRRGSSCHSTAYWVRRNIQSGCKAGWLPSESDQAFILSLMQGVTAPGKMAAWIAPPERGINNLPVEYEYVKLH